MSDLREPPPLFDDEENGSKEEEDEDLFSSVVETPPIKPEVNNKEAELEEEDEKEDLFADAVTEVPLDDSPGKGAGKTSENGSPPSLGVSQSAKSPAVTLDTHVPPAAAIKPPSASLPESRSKEEIDEEEGGDQFNMEITISDPKKIGDGMGAFMAYRVITKTTNPHFKKADMSVYRRFSDFLGLHEKLVEAHQSEGLIIPPPPEKSVLGMTKIKMSKEDSSSQDFIEKRRASLERFLNRTAKHPILQADTDFVEFLEREGDMPKSTSTQALSGAGMLRLFSKVGDSFGKMAFKMDESDQWFEEKQQQIEALDQQLKKLHSSIEALVTYRKELAVNTGTFAKSAAMLGNAEENTALSRALSQLAEIKKKKVPTATLR